MGDESWERVVYQVNHVFIGKEGCGGDAVFIPMKQTNAFASFLEKKKTVTDLIRYSFI
jgi:hypothetical protein